MTGATTTGIILPVALTVAVALPAAGELAGTNNVGSDITAETLVGTGALQPGVATSIVAPKNPAVTLAGGKLAHAAKNKRTSASDFKTGAPPPL